MTALIRLCACRVLEAAPDRHDFRMAELDAPNRVRPRIGFGCAVAARDRALAVADQLHDEPEVSDLA